MNYKQIIKTDLGEYVLSLVTEDFLYYANEIECDENACVIMTDKNGEVVSDNYFAYGSYIDDMKKVLKNAIPYEFVSESSLSAAKEYFERYPD